MARCELTLTGHHGGLEEAGLDLRHIARDIHSRHLDSFCVITPRAGASYQPGPKSVGSEPSLGTVM